MRLVRCEDGRLEIRLEQSAAKTLVNDLARKISQWTNRRWMVVVSAEAGQPTVKSQNEARQAELKTGVRADPLVEAVLARFPGAEIVDVRKGEMPAGAAVRRFRRSRAGTSARWTMVLPSVPNFRTLSARTTMILERRTPGPSLRGHELSSRRSARRRRGERWRISWA